VLYLPIAGTDEFYLLENRQAQESDSAQMNPAFGGRQKSPGLLIWHIDQGQVDQHGFDADNRVNVGPIHGVALVQADGRNDLRQPGGDNRGDRGDAFPGVSNNRSLCRATAPAANDNLDRFAHFCLDQITQLGAGNSISFRYISYHSVFAADRPGAVIQVNGATLSRLEQFFLPGTPIHLSVDSIQLDETGRSRYDYLAWSDGGSRSHSLVAGELPDTVTARLSSAHRLRITVQGAPMAAITAGVAGDLSAGVYLSEGGQVSLRAAPQSGAVFAGWSGDTTSTRDTLTLLMHRPFDLLANFVAIQEVVLTTAAQALFGTSMLESSEATYLDAVGNRNGIYDLGDFLAAFDRSPQ
jgi:Divergent InlB B-repeat domain